MHFEVVAFVKKNILHIQIFKLVSDHHLLLYHFIVFKKDFQS